MGDVTFLNKMAPYARQASGETGIPTSVILAQWAWESTWGKSKGAVVRNNYAGISNFTGSVPSWSKAYKVDPRPENEKGWYYNYKTVGDFVSDYVTVMKGPKYAGVRAAGSTPGLADDAAALGQSPYAASGYKKNGQPGGNIVDMIRQNELWKYDNGDIRVADLGGPAGTVAALDLDPKEVFKIQTKEGSTMLLLVGAAALAIMTMID